jgi:hypothetical protein
MSKITEDQLRKIIRKEINEGFMDLFNKPKTTLVRSVPSKPRSLTPEVIPAVSNKEKALQLAKQIQSSCAFFGDAGTEVPNGVINDIEEKIIYIIDFIEKSK